MKRKKTGLKLGLFFNRNTHKKEQKKNFFFEKKEALLT
jgi:hypothetical protein